MVREVELLLRLRDNVNRGGEKFGAEEVEALIAEHPSLSDARVVAMPDRFLGERPVPLSS